MTNIPRILSKVLNDFWCLTPKTHEAVITALESRLSGERQNVFTGDDDDGSETPSYYETGTTAVIPVHGILGKHLSRLEMMCGGCSMDAVSAMLDVADKSPRIERIILDINSPGGTVTGTPELARQILEIGGRKQTVAFTDADCCSGALWLASQCNLFYATGSSEIGSVGVRMILMDYTKMLEEEGVKVNAISSGKYKNTGAYFKPLEPDEREMLQTESDRIYSQFKEAVTVKRTVEEEHLQGQVFSGEIAAQLGFVDGLVDRIEDVIALPVR